MERPAAFIDRDGVINVEHDYAYKIDDFEWVPGVFDGLRRLQSEGFALIVVTNQAGIAKGYYAESDFDRLTARMLEQLTAEGIQIEKVYHCPHHPRAARADLRRNCACRKPAPGMLLQAASDLGLDLARSVLVGDKSSDVEAGRAAGVARCVLDIPSASPIRRWRTPALMIWQLLLSGSPSLATALPEMLTITITLLGQKVSIDHILDQIL